MGEMTPMALEAEGCPWPHRVTVIKCTSSWAIGASLLLMWVN